MENKLNPILRRQIRKMFRASDHSGCEEFQAFVDIVNSTYNSYEKEKKMTDHMFEMSSKDYQRINENLYAEKEKIEKSIKQLHLALAEFDTNAEDFEKRDLVRLAEFIKEKAIHQKQIEKELEVKRKEAVKASIAKTEFLSTMSHEIRTPLNVIVGLAHILLEDNHLSHQKENIEVLKINAENLKYLINDILDFSKIESGKLELEYTNLDLTEFLQRLKKAHLPKTKEKGLMLKLLLDSELPPVVMGDRVRLGQCLTNLIGNAIKFTSKGAVTISCTLLERDDQTARLRFQVEDTGIGMNEEAQKVIFQPFRQANSSTTRKFGGTGLGLSITINLIKLMGSTILLESEEGKGSSFYFDLDMPICEVQETDLPKKSKLDIPEDLNLGKKILLVEDYKFNVLIVEKLLGKYDLEIEVAENGKIGYLKATEKDYDLILMDINMPVMDGMESTKKIRAAGVTTPIIALTASTGSDMVDDMISIGMNGFISKPFDPKEFKSKLAKVLTSKLTEGLLI